MSWLTIEEAADRLDVSTKTIRRRIEKDKFPGAKKEGDGGHSDRWLIPEEDLNDSGAAVVPVESPEAAELREAIFEKRELTGNLERSERALEASKREAVQLRSDVEQERSRADRAEAEASSERARADVAQARAEERERLIAAVTEERDHARALAEATRTELEEKTERLRGELAEVQAVLGWRARRRLAKVRGNG